MQITDVRADLLSIPLRQDELASSWIAGGFRQQILVTVETDMGLRGFGEAFAYGAPRAALAVVNETLRPLLIGEDPRQISMLQDRMYPPDAPLWPLRHHHLRHQRRGHRPVGSGRQMRQYALVSTARRRHAD